jgi:hypothetical protein
VLLLYGSSGVSPFLANGRKRICTAVCSGALALFVSADNATAGSTISARSNGAMSGILKSSELFAPLARPPNVHVTSENPAVHSGVIPLRPNITGSAKLMINVPLTGVAGPAFVTVACKVVNSPGIGIVGEFASATVTPAVPELGFTVSVPLLVCESVEGFAGAGRVASPFMVTV